MSSGLVPGSSKYREGTTMIGLPADPHKLQLQEANMPTRAKPHMAAYYKSTKRKLIPQNQRAERKPAKKPFGGGG